MKMARLLAVLMTAFCTTLTVSAQTTDLFQYVGSEIQSKTAYISESSRETNSQSIPSEVKIYTYEKIELSSPSKQNKYSLNLLGFQPSCEEGFDGIRINDNSGKLLLTHWGYSPLNDVSYISMKPNGAPKYIIVPLDDDAFAIVLGGIIYDSDDDSPEMLIVVVKGNQAKVVYDGPALAYSYTSAPNFSVEFVAVMDWKQNSYGNDETPTAEPLSSKTKHKIWKEGNMLKYKSWK